LFAVKDDRGNVLGLLEKFPDTRSDKHPWKAYGGCGATAVFLGSFYPSEGGKEAALRAVLATDTDPALVDLMSTPGDVEF
jgi:hypothetical protein